LKLLVFTRDIEPLVFNGGLEPLIFTGSLKPLVFTDGFGTPGIYQQFWNPWYLPRVLEPLLFTYSSGTLSTLRGVLQTSSSVNNFKFFILNDNTKCPF